MFYHKNKKHCGFSFMWLSSTVWCARLQFLWLSCCVNLCWTLTEVWWYFNTRGILLAIEVEWKYAALSGSSQTGIWRRVQNCYYYNRYKTANAGFLLKYLYCGSSVNWLLFLPSLLLVCSNGRMWLRPIVHPNSIGRPIAIITGGIDTIAALLIYNILW